MIFTARQLEELHRSNGHVTLPYRARLTPLAQDWVRQKKIAIGYADVETKPLSPVDRADSATAALQISPFVWWCDGPCGPAKAALMSQSKESSLNDLGIASDANHLILAIKKIADEIKHQRVAGAILVVKSGAKRSSMPTAARRFARSSARASMRSSRGFSRWRRTCS